MAYSYVWPASLPQAPLVAGWGESGGPNIIRTPMDKGPAKQRRRSAKPRPMSVSFMMTAAQLATFETFVNDTIRGTARFGFANPRTGQVMECRIVPSDDGMYDISTPGGNNYVVSMQLEILP